MDKDLNSAYKARKNGGTYTVANILRFVGTIICIGAAVYLFTNFKDLPATQFELYFNILLLILGLGIGLALIGIAEIIFVSVDIQDNGRRSLYKNIVEPKDVA